MMIDATTIGGERAYLLHDRSNHYGSRLDGEHAIDESPRKRDRSPGLFSYANVSDKLLMAVGCVSALIHGASWSAFALAFGKVSECFMFAHIAATNNSSIFDQTLNQLDVRIASTNYSETIRGRVADNDADLAESLSLYDERMSRISIYFVCLGVVVMLSSHLQALCWQLSCNHQTYVLQQEFLYRVLRQDETWFLRYKRKEALDNLLENIRFVSEGIGLNVGAALQYSSTFLTAFTVGLYTQWKLATIAFCPLLLVAFTSGILWMYLERNVSKESAALDASGFRVKETIRCFVTISSLMGQRWESIKYEAALGEMNKWTTRKCILRALTLSLLVLGLYSSYASFVWCSTFLNISFGFDDFGDGFVVLFCVMASVFSISCSVPYFQSLVTAEDALTQLFRAVKTVPNFDPYSIHGKLISDVKGEITFYRVSFSIQERENLGSIHRICVKFHPGQMTAIVGAPNCGKKLIKELLLRFHDPREGQVLIDDYDLKSANVHSIRELVLVVEEEPVFLFDLIIENIVAGLERVTVDDVVRAAQKVCAHDFILSLPQGYSTSTKENRLTAEIKQMITMIRVALQDPKIVIIEECQRPSKLLQKALDAVRPQRTVIVLAKHVSTLKKSDRLLVLHDGWVVADGIYGRLYETERGINLVDYLGETQSVINDSREENTSRGECGTGRSKFVWKTNAEQSRRVTMSKYFFETVCGRKTDSFVLILGLLSAFAYGICPTIAATITTDIFDVFIQPRSTSSTRVAYILAVLAIGASITYFIRNIILQSLGESVLIRLRLDAYSRILEQSPSWFEADENQADVIARTMTDSTIASGFESILGILLANVVGCISSIVATLVIGGWQFFLFLIINVAVLIAFRRIFSIETKIAQPRSADFSQLVFDIVNKAWTIKAQSLERKIVEMFVDRLTEPYFLSKKNAHLYSLYFSSSTAAIYFVYAGLCVLASSLVRNEITQPAQTFSVFFLIAVCLVASSQSLSQYRVWQNISECFLRFSRFVDCEARQDGGIKSLIKGAIDLKQVYQYEAGRCVLRNVSLSVEPHRLIAIVGAESGRAILRIYTRQSDTCLGDAMLDTVRLPEYSLAHLRTNVCLICTPLLLPGSLRDNITYGTNVDGSNTSVFEMAVKLSGVDEFVRELPQGWATTFSIHDSPSKISIRDEIRVALARCYLRNARVLLFDQVFESLTPDDLTLAMVALDGIRKGRTCLVVTTRKALLDAADCILVFNQGSLIERGTHRQLLENRGFYYRSIHSKQNYV